MADLNFPSVFFLAPPFISHIRPMLSFAQALNKLGTEVTVGTDRSFQPEVEKLGLNFQEVQINKNANTGVALESQKNKEELHRLEEFLEATKSGAVETLMTQSRHRQADMFANPQEILQSIQIIQQELGPDLWVVDQLTYGATLALHGLGLPYISFCPPHPKSIPQAGMLYGVPPQWPQALKPSDDKLKKLETVAREVDQSFTRRFNRILRDSFDRPAVDSAFALCSSIAVVFNYPTFPSVENTRGLYLGHTITEEDLPEEYQTLVQKPGPKILIALGTFLSSRIDVLRKLISIVLKFEPGSQIFVGAGSGAPLLQQEFDSRVKISKFLPQRALLPQVDLVIHHGGVSSFTESLYHAVPMLVLPFSSDQFNVALDVEVNHLGRVCDPNAITEETVHSAWQALKSPQVMASLKHWSSRIRELGPHKAARILQTGG